jgi:hypothetical protein
VLVLLSFLGGVSCLPICCARIVSGTPSVPDQRGAFCMVAGLMIVPVVSALHAETGRGPRGYDLHLLPKKVVVDQSEALGEEDAP